MIRFRIFLSAVSSEFEQARTQVANDLMAKGLEVKVQDNFRQEVDACTTLELLHNYIRDCEAVVCMVGVRSGDFPPDVAALPYTHILPAGITRASYTQWEYFFARHYRKRCSMYWSKGYPPERDALATDDPTVQATYGQWLRDQGLYKNYFDSIDALCRQVNKEDWPNHAKPKPQNLPYPSLGTLFVGRDAFMQQLRASIEAHAQAVIKPRHAIHGLGGIGKTRLATEYAWQHKDQYSALLFVIAETPEALRRNLAMLCGPLVLDLPENSVREEEVQMAAALRWLKQHSNWFLLVDNVDTPEAVAEAERLLGQLSNGHVVYTSRMSNWAGHVQPLELDVLDEEVSAHFILVRTAPKRRKQPDDYAQARLIAQDVDGLALALEQACAFINARRLALAGYRPLWQEKHAEVLAWYDPAVMNYSKSVAITWQTSVDQLSADAKQLLLRLAWLSPEPIPESLLDVKAGADDTMDARAALVELGKYSLVTYAKEGEFFSLHRLVQDVIRTRLESRGKRDALVETTKWIYFGFAGEPQDYRSWPVMLPLAVHASAVATYALDDDILSPTCDLFERLGTLRLKQGLYGESSPYLTLAYLCARKAFGERSGKAAVALNNLSSLAKMQDDWALALNCSEEAVSIAEEVLDLADTALAPFVSNLGLIYQQEGDFEMAEQRLIQAKELLKPKAGGGMFMYSTAIGNLAELYVAMGDDSRAKPLTIEAHEIALEIYGADHPKVAVRKNNLAQLLGREERYGEAIPMLQDAVRIHEAAYGLFHPLVAENLGNLAGLLANAEQYTEAEKCYRRALTINGRAFQLGHSMIALSSNNLGAFLYERERYTEAEPYLRLALQTFVRKSSGPEDEHPKLQTAWANYEACLIKVGKTHDEIRTINEAMARGEEPVL